MNALLSLYSKPGAERFAQELIDRGYSIISSGGTAKYLAEHGIPVTDIASITGYQPVLKHRVVTLAPQIHGPLLATPEMYPELDALGWQRIDLLYVTFYPLEEELRREGATFESCIEKTDIGGPTMVRSANKGGNVIVMTSYIDERPVLKWLDDGMPHRKKTLFKLRANAENRVLDYIRLSAEVYERFGTDMGYPGRPDFPRYLMEIGTGCQFMPIYHAGVLFDHGQLDVRIGDYVIDRNLAVRRITNAERQQISDIAEEHSASK